MGWAPAAATLLIATGAAASKLTSGHAAIESAALHRRLGSDDKVKCNMKCNGEDVKGADVDAESWPLYECWGKFRVDCEADSDDKSVHTYAKCDGAFTSMRKKLDDDSHSDELEKGGSKPLVGPNGTETYTGCEGTFMEIIKVVSSAEEVGLMPAHEAKKCRKKKYRGGTKAVLSGAVCSGVLRGLDVVKHDGKVVGGYSCSKGYIDGAAVKFFPQHKSSKKHVMKKLKKAEKHFKKTALKKVGRKHHHHHHKHHKHNHREEREPEERAGQGEDWDMLRDSVRAHAAAQQAPGCVSAVAPGGRPHGECTMRCNRKPRGKWGKWWPCWGELDFDCKGSAEKVCFEDDFECTGVSWPLFKSCHGNFIQHQQIAIDTEKSDKMSNVEMLDLTTGYKRFMGVKKDGWKGGLTFARGHSSKRYSIEYGKKKEEQGGGQLATLGELNESADEQLESRE